MAVDGVLYIESALGNVIAVDGVTGQTKWRYDQTRGTLTRRGVAVGGGHVFTKSNENYVIALDQETGQVVWERQVNGFGNIEKVAVVYHDGLLFCGTNDGPRGAALALDARNGDVLWHFWGTPGPGEFGNDTWEGDSWMEGGATPWIHPAVDPELGLTYWTFGNARGSNSSQDGSARGGQNLFANSLVALDMRTGAYRWHFQSIHHDIWDMDNVMAPVLADVRIRGRERKVVVYGSKSGMFFILDRTDGTAPLGIVERPVPQEPRQKTWPTQPFPVQGGWTEQRVVDQPLGTSVPGDPNRAVPNYVQGALYDPHWDMPILSIPGHGGGADWSHLSFSHRTGLVYTGFGYVAAAHSLTESSNGLRPPGEYQTGGIVAVDVSTNRVTLEAAHAVLAGPRQRHPHHRERPDVHRPARRQPARPGRPHRPRAVAVPDRRGDQLQPDHVPRRRQGVPRRVRRRHQHPVRQLRAARRLPVGVRDRRSRSARRRRRRPRWSAGRSPAARSRARPWPTRSCIGRTYNAATGHDRRHRVVRGRRHGARPTCGCRSARPSRSPTIPATPAPRGVTQFFEGLFDVRLDPGESFQYTFTRAGEYFFNDPGSPRSTGKIEVY